MKRRIRALLMGVLSTALAAAAARGYARRGSVKRLEFFEMSLSPIEDLGAEEKIELRDFLKKRFVSSGTGAGFRRGRISEGKSRYAVLDLWYAADALRMIGQQDRKEGSSDGSGNRGPGEGAEFLTPDVRLPVSRNIAYLKEEKNLGHLTAADEAACLCLMRLTGDQDAGKEAADWIAGNTDPGTGLLFENQGDPVEEELSFTCEAVRMFRHAGIAAESPKWYEAAERFLAETDWKGPEDGDTIFNSGGLAVYCADLLGVPLPGETGEWFSRWRTATDGEEAASWDDVLEMTAVYLPLADLFGGDAAADDRNFAFISERDGGESGIGGSLDVSILERYAARMDRTVLEAYRAEAAETIGSVCRKLEEISAESTFYGIQLAAAAGYPVDHARVIQTCSEQLEGMSAELFGSDAVRYEEAASGETSGEDMAGAYSAPELSAWVTEAWSVMMMAESEETGGAFTGTEEFRGCLRQCMDEAAGGESNDPVFYLRICEMAGHAGIPLTESFRSYLREWMRGCLASKAFAGSLYMADLFEIDCITGFGIAGQKQVSQVLAKYLEEKEDDGTDDAEKIEKEFRAQVLLARFGGFAPEDPGNDADPGQTSGEAAETGKLQCVFGGTSGLSEMRGMFLLNCLTHDR